MEGVGAAVEDILNVGGDGRTGGPFLGKTLDLLGSGDLAGDQEPEKTFRERFLATFGFGEELLAFGNGVATETDTLFR